MGRLVVNMFVTLDGVIQAPGMSDEDREAGFEHGGWQGPLMDEESGRTMGEHVDRLDALLLGRKTYDIFASYWPNAETDLSVADKLNSAPKYIASRTLKSVDWNNSQLLEGDIGDAVRAVKQKHEEVHVIGSGDLVQTLLRNELVDRMNLWLYPIVLGTGKKLFGEGSYPRRSGSRSPRPFPRAPFFSYTSVLASPATRTWPRLLGHESRQRRSPRSQGGFFVAGLGSGGRI